MSNKVLKVLKKELLSLVKYKVLLNVLKAIVVWINAIITTIILKQALLENIYEVMLFSFMLLGIILTSNIIHCLIHKQIQISEGLRIQRCKEEIYELYMKKDYRDIAKDNYGDCKEHIIDDFNKIIEKYTICIPTIFSSAVIIMLYVVYITIKSRWMSVTLLLISMIQVIVPFISRKFLIVNYEKMRSAEAELTDYIVSGYNGFELLKVFSLKNWYLSGLKKIHKKYCKIGTNSEVIAMSENVLDNLVRYILTYGLYVLIYGYIALGFITLETATEIVVMSGTFFAYVKSVFDAVLDIAVISTAIKRIEEWLRNGKEKYKENISSIKIKDLSVRNLKCKHVENILDIKELYIDLKKKNILTGKNGSGKTTFLNIIMGECDYDGYVYFGGISEEFIEESIFDNMYAYLKQHVPELSVFACQLFEQYNIEIKETAVKNAKDFGLTDNIINGIRICDMSVGTRKKVFLSLILSWYNKTLVLDEPANDLDIKGREILHQRLKQHKGGYLIITHEENFTDFDFIYSFDGKENVYVSKKEKSL